MIVTIHQANLLPYEGVLDKARRADIFVALTHVQFTRSYHNRFKVGDRWLTMSVSNSQSRETLRQKRYVKPQEDWLAIKRKIRQYSGVLERFDDLISFDLVDTNIAVMKRLFAMLGIGAQVVLDYPTQLSSTERLVDLCRYYRATTYLSGPSGHLYMDETSFRKAGIAVEYNLPRGQRAAVEILEERHGRA